jgi:hypothetical protein
MWEAKVEKKGKYFMCKAQCRLEDGREQNKKMDDSFMQHSDKEFHSQVE